MKKIYVIAISLMVSGGSYAQDWKDIPVPAEAGQGNVWQLDEVHSNSFNYTSKNDPGFANSGWRDQYHNGWTGPGLTFWNSDMTQFDGNNLVIKATRSQRKDKNGRDMVDCGVATSKVAVTFPIYVEVSMKPSNQVLSSNFWLLSADDKRELDIVEIYGGDRPDQTWFAARPSTNYHFFIRDTEGIHENLNDQEHHTLPNNEPWRNDFHRFGAYWKSEWEVDFYYNGQLVDTFRKEKVVEDINDLNTKDKKNLTLQNFDNVGLDRSMFLIIDTEDHDWRSDMGVVASDAELADETKNKMLVNWVRVYKPVDESSLSIEEADRIDFVAYPNPATDVLYVQTNSNTFTEVTLRNTLGSVVFSDTQTKVIDVSELAAGMYFLDVIQDNKKATRKIIVQ